MENKISRDNVKRYAVTGLLLTNLLVASGCFGLSLYDSCVEHTQEVCAITKMSTSFGNSNSVFFKKGIEHQIVHMTKEYMEQGYRANVSFNPECTDLQYETVKVLPSVNIDENNRIVEYVAPVGYSLEYVNDKYYAVKTIVNSVGKPYMAFQTEIMDDSIVEPIVRNGEYEIPAGYRLEQINGEFYLVKTNILTRSLKFK